MSPHSQLFVHEPSPHRISPTAPIPRFAHPILISPSPTPRPASIPSGQPSNDAGGSLPHPHSIITSALLPSTSRQDASQSPAPLSSKDDVPTVTRARLSIHSGYPTYVSPTSDGKYICNICPVERNTRVFKRETDYKRHMGSHFPESRVSFICCGAPVEMSNDPLYREKLGEDPVVRTFYGQQMVGGCGQLLSRKDALKRHLELSSHCMGDPTGYWYSRKGNERV
ncbi:hypothetical protein BDY19DRAFT_995753 [Irpex rosettiformis]|uniref:Uncharacterized protein n=1 Tax=Irpex rosettiformis TaxID=378272 RepID=A0ACB8TWY6_9APHY|nr:hypothetical protein BDY19DRAFT_995753 [Irpex rosettiformis]